jgi:hypothetical protein
VGQVLTVGVPPSRACGITLNPDQIH